jgi:D-alanyl-lipoteichoic acid acyltransferase DltB (MBOAT superfamily)
MAGTVVALLGVLGWFKYYGFLALNLDNTLHLVGLSSVIPLFQVVLPVGISFFTFMAISYVVDVYRRDVKPAPWLDFAVYLSFFPHLVAGPIVRGSELLPQVRARRDPRRIDVGRAAYLVLGGLFKKVVVASFLATAIVDPVFGAPGQHSAVEILVAVTCTSRSVDRVVATGRRGGTS